MEFWIVEYTSDCSSSVEGNKGRAREPGEEKGEKEEGVRDE